jgi:hypothetical protein
MDNLDLITKISVMSRVFTRWTILFFSLGILPYGLLAQKTGAAQAAKDTTKQKPAAPSTGPKPYGEVITEKAKTMKGFFTVHKMEEKYFFEIPDSILGLEWMAVVRTSQVPTGAGYGGVEVNEQTFRWEKGPDNKIFLRVVAHINIASDSLPINQAVKVSNVEPIAAAFDIKAYSKDSSAVVIEVTDLFKGDNPATSLPAAYKKSFGLLALSPDRSFINYIHSYPLNTEVKSTKTYAAGGPVTAFILGGNGTTSLPTASAADAVTFEVNVSMISLPRIPMKRRFYNPRVGYFSSSYTNYGLDEQKVKSEQFINHWRLEPRPEDLDKMSRGELVEPAKPIVFYIDPATPFKWRPFLKQAVEDWNKAFEKAGFKNAIWAKDWPAQDSTMSLEDARYSVIRYFASDIQNAYGPNVADPRSGEILESHVGWYHNVMDLARNWYLVQASAVDPAARHAKFDDELMGALVRYICSHEIGHTLGLPHNFGSSSSVPVEKLRDKKWVEAHGHTPSIMDYARFNYVAQPEDSIGRAGLFPRIGDYDLWSIEWGYKIFPGKDEYEEKKILSDWAVDKNKDPRYRYLKQRALFPDPRAQSEDLGDNAMKAGEYGIKNLKRILPNLRNWTQVRGEGFEELDELYQALLFQFQMYCTHVSNNIGGVYEDWKGSEEEGEVFTPVPSSLQREAVRFLLKNAFETPNWLLDWGELKTFDQDQVVEEIRSFQEGRLNYLLSAGRLARMIENEAMAGKQAYGLDEFFNDLQKGIYREIYERKSIDVFKRNLQKVYLSRLVGILHGEGNFSFSFTASGNYNPRRVLSNVLGITQVDPAKDDIFSVIKGNLKSLRRDILSSLPSITDRMTKFHLEDVADRIDKALNPK